MDERIAGGQLAARRELGHARRGPGAARAAVDRLAAVENRVARVRLRVARLAGPEDVGHAADRLVLRMDRLYGRFQVLPQDEGHAHEIAGGEVLQVAVVRLRLHDGVEVAAVGDIHRELTQARALGLDPLGGQIGAHVVDAHGVHMAVAHRIVRLDGPRGRVQAQGPVLARLDQAALDREGDRPDRAVAAHGQAAGGLDVQHTHVAFGVRGRVKDRPRHHVVAARSEADKGVGPKGPVAGAVLGHRSVTPVMAGF